MISKARAIPKNTAPSHLLRRKAKTAAASTMGMNAMATILALWPTCMIWKL